jgi:hypothetical protein
MATILTLKRPIHIKTCSRLATICAVTENTVMLRKHMPLVIDCPFERIELQDFCPAVSLTKYGLFLFPHRSEEMALLKK